MYTLTFHKDQGRYLGSSGKKIEEIKNIINILVNPSQMVFKINTKTDCSFSANARLLKITWKSPKNTIPTSESIPTDLAGNLREKGRGERGLYSFHSV